MRLLVTLGSDGTTDWVRTPDGQRFNLGSVSALSFVTKLALGGAKDARLALDGFLQGKEVILKVDDDHMWDLLTPVRRRWAADSFIPPDHRKRGNEVMAIDTDLTTLERHVEALNSAAGKVSVEKMTEGVGILVRLAGKINADQSDNSKYYGLGVKAQEDPKPEVTTVEDVDAVKIADDKVADEDEAPKGLSKLAYDTYTANGELATQILDQMDAVNSRIDELVTAGKKFNAKQAKMDAHKVTRKVAGIVNDVDLTTPWVAGDLQKIAARAEHLHGLFFSKK
jgi:hypothetical protein